VNRVSSVLSKHLKQLLTLYVGMGWGWEKVGGGEWVEAECACVWGGGGGRRRVPHSCKCARCDLLITVPLLHADTGRTARWRVGIGA
jgi:hypothetical protein